MAKSKKRSESAEGKRGLELLLSILLAVSMSYALTLFMDLNSIGWIILSLFSIGITISVIYALLDLGLPKSNEWLMLSSIALGIMLPFSLKKSMEYLASASATTGNWWSQEFFFGHLITLGILISLWGNSEKPKRKGYIWTGIIMIILTLLIIGLIYGGVIQNG